MKKRDNEAAATTCHIAIAISLVIAILFLGWALMTIPEDISHANQLHERETSNAIALYSGDKLDSIIEDIDQDRDEANQVSYVSMASLVATIIILLVCLALTLRKMAATKASKNVNASG